jgi:hypothetical protein
MGVTWSKIVDTGPGLMAQFLGAVTSWGEDQVERVKADIEFGHSNNWFGYGFEGFIKEYDVKFSMDKLIKFFETWDDPAWLWKYFEPITKHGTNQHTEKVGGDNVTSTTERGNKPEYIIRRLKRDAPKIADEVIEGKLSPYAGAIKAGFKKRMVSVEPSVEGFSKAILKHLDDDQIQTLISLL